MPKRLNFKKLGIDKTDVITIYKEYIGFQRTYAVYAAKEGIQPRREIARETIKGLAFRVAKILQNKYGCAWFDRTFVPVPRKY